MSMKKVTLFYFFIIILGNLNCASLLCMEKDKQQKDITCQDKRTLLQRRGYATGGENYDIEAARYNERPLQSAYTLKDYCLCSSICAMSFFVSCLSSYYTGSYLVALAAHY
jgi:hypothetical protein